MTDTTDIAALREAAMKATPGPWSVARDGSVISNQYHPLATVSDGFHRLRSDGETGQDAEFIALANPATILSLLGQLEAECQRADEAIQLNPLAVDVSELEATYIGDIRIHMAAISEYKQRAESAEAEIADLKAKLANPVVLPQRYVCEGYHLEPEPEGECYDRDEVIEAIQIAGFTVKGE
ncbi:ead/Ea22-like family protein [Rahnella bonaserana]|uniref:ead/Ea22-like family protein n=1 Tax=Rahnella bonaserana TaxID=2816248 RepID=UPI003209A722